MNEIKNYLIVFVGAFHMILYKLDISDGFLQFQRKTFGNALTRSMKFLTTSSHL